MKNRELNGNLNGLKKRPVDLNQILYLVIIIIIFKVLKEKCFFLLIILLILVIIQVNLEFSKN